jgi:5-methylcytosine-specific restriction endonuclease McrA
MYERDPVLQKFRNSRKWRNTAAAYAKSKCYICEKCGNKNINPNIRPITRQLQVHHKIPITPQNVDDLNISLNWDNFQLLCTICHNAERYGEKDVVAPGLEFDEHGMLRKKE